LARTAARYALAGSVARRARRRALVVRTTRLTDPAAHAARTARARSADVRAEAPCRRTEVADAAPIRVASVERAANLAGGAARRAQPPAAPGAGVARSTARAARATRLTRATALLADAADACYARAALGAGGRAARLSGRAARAVTVARWTIGGRRRRVTCRVVRRGVPCRRIERVPLVARVGRLGRPGPGVVAATVGDSAKNQTRTHDPSKSAHGTPPRFRARSERSRRTASRAGWVAFIVD
jgi:hypothetical protein